MNAMKEAPANVLFVTLEYLFDSARRRMPKESDPEQRAIELEAYYSEFRNDPPTPRLWQVRAWLRAGYPVVIYTSMPEQFRADVCITLAKHMPDAIQPDNWPSNLEVVMPDHKKGWHASTALESALDLAESWGGVCLAGVTKSLHYIQVSRRFPKAVVTCDESK